MPKSSKKIIENSLEEIKAQNTIFFGSIKIKQFYRFFGS